MKLIVPAFLFLATSVFAQRPAGPPPGRDHIATMTTLLSLNAGQAATATKTYADAATATKALRGGMRTAQNSLADAIKKNDVGSIDTLTAQIGTLHAQELSINSKAEASFYSTLSADQQAKYDTLHHGGFGHGGLGGPGGPRRN